MKPIGIVRQIDSLGRIVIPKEIRRTLEINEGDALEMFIEDGTIILKKYQPVCFICRTPKNISTYKGKNFCPDCVRDMANKLL